MADNPFSFADPSTTQKNVPPPVAAPSAGADNPFAFAGAASSQPAIPSIPTVPSVPSTAPDTTTDNPFSFAAAPNKAATSGNPFAFADDGGRKQRQQEQETEEQQREHQFEMPILHSQNLHQAGQDLSQGKIGRTFSDLWEGANVPVFDLHAIDRNWLHQGDESKMVGAERGVTNFLSGFSSPFQIALTVGTWGSSSVLEAGGEAALKAAGMEAGEISQVMKGAEIITKEANLGKVRDVADAIPALQKAGLNPELVQKGLETLKTTGLSMDALTDSSIVRRGVSSALRFAGKNPVVSEKIGQGVQALVNMGFTSQMAYGTIASSAQMFDAIRDKDWDKVQRLAVESAGSGLMAYAGAKHFMHEAGSAMDGALAATGMKVKPTEENLRLIRETGVYERERITAQREAELMKDELDKLKLSPESKARVRTIIEANMNPMQMAQQGNHLLEAAGRSDRLDVPFPVEKAKAAAALSQMSQTEGGGTYSMHLGDMKGKEAFAVAAHPERSLTLDHDPSPEEVQQFIEKNADLLQRTDRSVGIWNDKDTGRRILDVVATPTDESTALKIATVGRERPEEAYYDLKNAKTIPVPPSPESLRAKYGTAKNVFAHEASFLLPNGDYVGLPAGTTHDAALGAKPTDNARVFFIDNTGTIRARYRMSRAGEEVVFSIPSHGVTEDQARQMRYAASEKGLGRMVIEVASLDRDNPRYEVIDDPNGNKVMQAVTKMVGEPRPASIEQLVAANDPTALDEGVINNFKYAFPNVEEEAFPVMLKLMKMRAAKLGIPFDQFMVENFKAFDRGGSGSVPAAGAFAQRDFVPPTNLEKGIDKEDAVDTRIPISELSLHKRSMNLAERDIARGAPSRTEGPVEVFYDTAKKQYLVADGQHRVMEAIQRGDKDIPAKLWSGYSDTIAPVYDKKDLYVPPQPLEQRAEPLQKVPRGSTVSIRDNPLKVGDQPNIEDIGKALQEHSISGLGDNERSIEQVRKIAASELQRQLLEENSGRDWYTKDISRMRDAFAKVHPELATDDKMFGFFRALGAAASLGNESQSAMGLLDEIYSMYKENGKIPTRYPNGDQFGSAYPQAVESVLENITKVLDHVGGDPRKAYDWMMSKHTVEELNAVKGRPKSPVQGKKTDVRYGAHVLGRKAGPFFLNMNGIAEELTVDRWFARTWNRWMGTLVMPDGKINEHTPNQEVRALMNKTIGDLGKPYGLNLSETQAVLWYYEQALWKAHGLDIVAGDSYGAASERHVAQRGIDFGAVRPEENAGDRGTAEEGGTSALAKRLFTEGRGTPAAGAAQAGEGTEEGDTSFDPRFFAQHSEEVRPTEDQKPLTERGNTRIATGAENYIRQRGLTPSVARRVIDADDRARAIADAYEQTTHDPNNPRVKASYNALKDDVKEQWNYATKEMGIRFEPASEDPYQGDKPSALMMKDVQENNRLRFFKTLPGSLPADHPMAEIDAATGLSYNDMFRAIHDLFGHAAEGFEFGAKGEENAWNAHRRMFGQNAQPALATETKGQNSWVNSGKHLRDAEGRIAKKGEKGYVSPQERPFAQQKAALLPPEFWTRPDDVPQSSRDIPSRSGNAAGAQRDNDILSQVKAEHPEWNISQQLQEAAKRSAAPARPRYGFTDFAKGYEPYVEWMPISELKKFREYDRAVTPKWKSTPTNYIDELASKIKKNGLEEPLMMEYSTSEKKALMTEGNHRLAALERAGYTEAPVRVYKREGSMHGKGVDVPGFQGDRHVPADMKPSDIGLGSTPENGGLSPVGSGTSAISNEEIARNEVFYKIDKMGRFTYQGKQPDPISMKAGDTVVGVNPRTLAIRHADGDYDTAQRFGRNLVKTIFEQRAKRGEVKGTTEFVNDGRAIIRGFQSGDISTLLHEVIHVFRRTLTPDEQSRAESIYGVKGGKWTVAQEEKFARDGERAHLDGYVSDKPEIQDVFTKMKNWLKDIYKSVANSSLRDSLTREKRDFWDNMYGIRSREHSRPGEEMDYARIRELVGQQHVAKKYTPQEIEALKNAHDPSKLTDVERHAAQKLSSFFAETLDKAKAAGVLKEGAEHYVTNYWQKEEANNPALQQILHSIHNGGDFHVTTPMARHRIFNSAFEGRLLGKKLSVEDPIALAANNRAEFGKIIAARKFLERLRDSNLRASDGRPLVALSGTGQVVEDDSNANPAVLVNPNGSRSLRIADHVIDGLKKSGELDKLVAQGVIDKLQDKKGNDFYAYNTTQYKSLDHPAFRDWNWMAQAGNTPVLLNSDLRVHPAAEQYLKRFLGTEKGLKEIPAVGTALKVGAGAKHLMLSLSPFHLIQEGARAVMTGISPFGMEKWDLASNPRLSRLVEHGLTLGKDFRSINDWQDGVSGNSKLIEKVPGLGKVQHELETFLFEKYIPALKARAAQHLFDRYKEKYPEWSESKQYEEAAADANERFGGINYKRMGRSAMTQDTLRLLTLAPDWLESEIRSMARVFGDNGRVARADVAKFALYMWAASRVLNYAFTGQGNYHVPFGVAIKDKEGKEKVYQLRTLPTDILHAASDPGNFLKGRVSPLVRAGQELYTGRDEFGRKIPTHSLMLQDIARNFMPISAQAVVKEPMPLTGRGDQLLKAGGITVHPYRTESMKKADDLASDRTEGGQLDSDQLARHRAVLDYEDKLVARELQPGDVVHAVEQGVLHRSEMKQIMNNYKMIEQARTAVPNMDGDTARLITRASRLPMKDFMTVWDLTTPTEKAALSMLLKKKMRSYFKRITESLPPKEWRQDPTYNRLRDMFPNEVPQ